MGMPELNDPLDSSLDGPGDWVTAGFDSPCSRGYCSGIAAGEDIRADGDGGWECRSCVEMDTAGDLGACDQCGAAFQSMTNIHADGKGDAICGNCLRENNS